MEYGQNMRRDADSIFRWARGLFDATRAPSVGSVAELESLRVKQLKKLARGRTVEPAHRTPVSALTHKHSSGLPLHACASRWTSRCAAERPACRRQRFGRVSREGGACGAHVCQC